MRSFATFLFVYFAFWPSCAIASLGGVSAAIIKLEVAIVRILLLVFLILLRVIILLLFPIV